MSAARELDELREAIARCDRAILDQLHKRMELAARVGERKAERGETVVAAEVEASVLGRARAAARTCGVSAEVLEEVFRAVIRASVERQHRIHCERRRGEAAGDLLVLGAAGGMGGWFRAFGELLGHRIVGVDPAFDTDDAEAGCLRSLEAVDDLDRFDALVVAAPLSVMAEATGALVERRPRGLVYELASIKAPLVDAHRRADQLGVRLRSIHPMFGPGKAPYDPLTFVVCGGDAERTECEALFAHPFARWVAVPLEDHDPLMGWLLGLGHLSGMLFATALGRSGQNAELLHACASTTFLRQTATARSILDEDPALYLDIQHRNPARAEVYRVLESALGEYRRATASGDLESFRALLNAGREHVARGEGALERRERAG